VRESADLLRARGYLTLPELQYRLDIGSTLAYAIRNALLSQHREVKLESQMLQWRPTGKKSKNFRP
jgi:hypothetical protein